MLLRSRGIIVSVSILTVTHLRQGAHEMRRPTGPSGVVTEKVIA
jgi:hypothetical protein